MIDRYRNNGYGQQSYEGIHGKDVQLMDGRRGTVKCITIIDGKDGIWYGIVFRKEQKDLQYSNSEVIKRKTLFVPEAEIRRVFG